MNDFDDETAGAVRSLYLDPDAAAPDESDGRRDPSSLDLSGEAAADLDASGGALVPSDVPLGGALVPSDASLRGAASRSDLERATDDSFPVNPSGPPPRRSAAAERARLAAQQHFMLRPFRLLVVGKEAPYTVEDQVAIIYAGSKNLLRNVPVNKVKEFEKDFLAYMNSKNRATLDALKAGKLDDSITDVIEAAAKEISAKYN